MSNTGKTHTAGSINPHGRPASTSRHGKRPSTSRISSAARRTLIMALVDGGEEHIARARYGDSDVTEAIRADLESQGFDADRVFADANGYEAPR